MATLITNIDDVLDLMNWDYDEYGILKSSEKPKFSVSCNEWTGKIEGIFKYED